MLLLLPHATWAVALRTQQPVVLTIPERLQDLCDDRALSCAGHYASRVCLYDVEMWRDQMNQKQNCGKEEQ